MNIRKIISLIILMLFINTILILTLSDHNEDKLNIVEINDIKETLAENWDTLGEGELPGLQYDLDYVVLNSQNQLIAKTRDGIYTNLYTSISHRDTIIDILSDNEIVGKLIIYNDTENFWNHYKQTIIIYTLSIMVSIFLLSLTYTNYLNKKVIQPFKKLQKFAKQIALGNLDIPLEMDRGNLFGAFTESFDLMREELKKARDNERKANQSKKELVASLSHDIKTPVASIKAVSEIMSAKTYNEAEIKQLEIINSKADQINTLITNMFNATLEELQELEVAVIEASSVGIYELIKNADYNNRVKILKTSDCIVLLDHLRLSQVIDNVISNSYKYANTKIEVKTIIRGKYFEMIFKDFGKGIPKEELPLIFNKFYRAKNTEGKSGTGLGLYISKYLMTKMQGDIECENVEDGFVTKLKLRIL